MRAKELVGFHPRLPAATVKTTSFRVFQPLLISELKRIIGDTIGR
jgi:hypothetical protein